MNIFMIIYPQAIQDVFLSSAKEELRFWRKTFQDFSPSNASEHGSL